MLAGSFLLPGVRGLYYVFVSFPHRVHLGPSKIAKAERSAPFKIAKAKRYSQSMSTITAARLP
jgi:hypothetical protein